jgi:F420H(2)-dependent quinone reductase
VDGIFTTRFVDPYLRFHKYIYERSEGRVGKHSNRVPALLLTTVGRRSGLPRTNGLTYCRDRGDIIVVASNGGSARPPAWLLNLEANPEVTIRLGRRVLQATARVATPEERSQLWPLVNRTNRGMSRLFHRGVRGRYDVYQRHTSRQIPVVIITPARDTLVAGSGESAPDPETVSRGGRAVPARSVRRAAGS